MNEQSLSMRLFTKLGMEKTAWALRRLYCPVSRNALVLEVGSGGNPFPRANVLLDAYEDTRERHWAPLVADRPTVLGYVERLPFRDKAFDFVIACHVLEHSPDPSAFLAEIQRVGRAGYIESPDAFMERINPYRDHRLEVTVRGGALVIRKKESWIIERETVELYEHRAKDIVARMTIPQSPFSFHVRYFWVDRISYRILNPDISSAWQAPEDGGKSATGSAHFNRSILQRALRSAFSQRARNRSLDLLPLLLCPDCRSNDLRKSEDAIACVHCGSSFPIRKGIHVMYPSTPADRRQ
jgi:uncharacterized protein YbaR (Trm112 family)